MRLIKEIAFAVALSLALLYGIAKGEAHEIKVGDIIISHLWMRQPPPGSSVAAGFMTITNNGKEDDRLISATAEVAPMVQLHEMKMVGDVMKMQEVQGGIVIPAGQTVELKPKSLHVMFMNLKSSLVVGEEIKGALTFEKAGTVNINYEVMSPDAGMN
jgi:copper(I)-binding protein